MRGGSNRCPYLKFMAHVPLFKVEAYSNMFRCKRKSNKLMNKMPASL